MDVNETFVTSDIKRRLTSRHVDKPKASLTTTESSHSPLSKTVDSDRTIDLQSEESERWSSFRIAQELLRERLESSSTPDKNLIHNQVSTSEPATEERQSLTTHAKTSASLDIGPDLFVVSQSASLTGNAANPGAISQAKQDTYNNCSLPGGNSLKLPLSASLAVDKPLRRRASLPLPNLPSSKKVKISLYNQQTRGRMASLEKQPKPKDWSKATEKPSGLEKKETDTCLTCINYGRQCKGTILVEAGVRSGTQEVKCSPCASKLGHGGRRCYWKDSSKNINTYDEARIAYGGIVNFKNTRAGRIERAKQDPNSRLALDANLPYVPPSPESREPSGYQTMFVKPEQKVSFTTLPTAARKPDASLSPGHVNKAGIPAVIFDRDEGDPDSEIDDEDIKFAFNDAMAEVKGILQTHFGNRWSKQELWTSMFVYVATLDARKAIIEGINTKLTLLRNGALVEDWIGGDD